MGIIVCKKCSQKYGYEEWGDIYPGGKDREEAACPYCGEVGYSRMTSGFIRSYKVNDKDEEIHE